MGLTISKHRAFAEREAWARAFAEIGKELGYDSMADRAKVSPILKAMGGLSYGRYEHEPSADDSKDRAVMALGWFEARRIGLMQLAEAVGDEKARRLFAGAKDRFWRICEKRRLA